MTTQQSTTPAPPAGGGATDAARRPGPAPGGRPPYQQGGRPPYRGGGGAGGGGGFRPRRGRPRYFARRKICSFCVDKIEYIDYKDVARLRRFISDRYKMEARRKTGVCSKHQRMLARAIKRARVIALLPYSPDHKMPGGGYAA